MRQRSVDRNFVVNLGRGTVPVQCDGSIGTRKIHNLGLGVKANDSAHRKETEPSSSGPLLVFVIGISATGPTCPDDNAFVDAGERVAEVAVNHDAVDFGVRVGD